MASQRRKTGSHNVNLKTSCRSWGLGSTSTRRGTMGVVHENSFFRVHSPYKCPKPKKITHRRDILAPPEGLSSICFEHRQRGRGGFDSSLKIAGQEPTCKNPGSTINRRRAQSLFRLGFPHALLDQSWRSQSSHRRARSTRASRNASE